MCDFQDGQHDCYMFPILSKECKTCKVGHILKCEACRSKAEFTPCDYCGKKTCPSTSQTLAPSYNDEGWMVLTEPSKTICMPCSKKIPVMTIEEFDEKYWKQKK